MADTYDFLGETSDPTGVPPSGDEKNIALLAHIITIISTFIGPLIIYLLKKDESEFVKAHAAESLNFQITMALLTVLLFVSIVGILLVWAVGIFALIMVIIATIRAADGKLFRYPFTIRFIK